VNETEPASDSGNPFSTRRVRPGAAPYLFPPGLSVESLVDRLRRFDWMAQIIGPHGSGKSALLAALLPAIEQAGRQTVLVTLHDGQRRLPLSPRRDVPRPATTLLVIDGYEQLNRWNRWQLRRFCRRHAAGLLVTAHESVGLPTLFHAAPTPELFARIVEHLMAGRNPSFTSAELAECFSKHRGNLREALFDLYDLFDQRRSIGTAAFSRGKIN